MNKPRVRELSGEDAQRGLHACQRCRCGARAVLRRSSGQWSRCNCPPRVSSSFRLPHSPRSIWSAWPRQRSVNRWTTATNLKTSHVIPGRFRLGPSCCRTTKRKLDPDVLATPGDGRAIPVPAEVLTCGKAPPGMPCGAPAVIHRAEPNSPRQPDAARFDVVLNETRQ